MRCRHHGCGTLIRDTGPGDDWDNGSYPWLHADTGSPFCNGSRRTAEPVPAGQPEIAYTVARYAVSARDTPLSRWYTVFIEPAPGERWQVVLGTSPETYIGRGGRVEDDVCASCHRGDHP